MTIRSCRIFPIVLGLLALSWPARAQLYSVRDLGATDGALSRPFGINNRGQVVALNRTAGVYRAFLYERGIWTNLGSLGGNYSAGLGIGGAGHVAGISTNAANARRGFLWTPGGTNGVAGNPQMREIGTLGGALSEGYAVNQTGVWAGMAATATRQQALAVSGTNLLLIGGLLLTNLNFDWSYAYGINDRGDAVGLAYSNNNFTFERAFLYAGGAVTNLGHLGGTNAAALAINTNRQVTGYSKIAANEYRAFRWTAGAMENLGVLGGTFSQGFAINRQGHVVGESTVDGSTNLRAFIAFSNAAVDLHSLVDASASNWIFLEARGINDSGQIVGLGRRDTSIRMFLLNPIPKITSIVTTGNEVLVHFDSINQAGYGLETSTNLLHPAWASESLVVTGNGGVAVAPLPAGPPAHMRRIRLLTP